jgi:hypothetical protein
LALPAPPAALAFDLLRLDGDDLRLRPIEARREALMRLVAGANGIVFDEAIVAEGAVVFAKACALGLEGIVSPSMAGIGSASAPVMAQGPGDQWQAFVSVPPKRHRRRWAARAVVSLALEAVLSGSAQPLVVDYA